MTDVTKERCYTIIASYDVAWNGSSAIAVSVMSQSAVTVMFCPRWSCHRELGRDWTRRGLIRQRRTCPRTASPPAQTLQHREPLPQKSIRRLSNSCMHARKISHMHAHTRCTLMHAETRTLDARTCTLTHYTHTHYMHITRAQKMETENKHAFRRMRWSRGNGTLVESSFLLRGLLLVACGRPDACQSAAEAQRWCG